MGRVLHMAGSFLAANVWLEPVRSDDYLCDIPPFPVNYFNILDAFPKAIRAHLPTPLPLTVHDRRRQPLEESNYPVPFSHH